MTTAQAITPKSISQQAAWKRLATYGAAGAYFALVAITIHYHEPWADEAQAWLLARDATLPDLWTRLLHYEGTPGLWHSVLHLLIRAGLPYSALNCVSGIFGSIAAWLLLRYSPLPLAIRLLLPFTYYICYQYSVVARSYSLLPLLLFASATIYRPAAERPWILCGLLCAMAGTSAHGFLISACIWVGAAGAVRRRWNFFPASQRRRIVAASLFYALWIIAMVVCAWPASDCTFAPERGHLPALAQVWNVSESMLGEAFTGGWISSLVVIALSFPLLWRGGGWLIFLLSTVGLCIFGTLVYAQVWHDGIIFLVWIFALWISAPAAHFDRWALAALLIVISIQCYWSYRAVTYDWHQLYSGSLQAARFLKASGIAGSSGIYAIGYSSTALQPYFPRNIYSSFSSSGRGGYWDWSNRNHANELANLLSSPQREIVLVGYKANLEKLRWKRLLTKVGYREINHFEGRVFWHTQPFEPESFDLYRRAPGRNDIKLPDDINMADTSSGDQLLSGFYGVEPGGWRWTAKRFSVLLGPPSRDGQRSAKLVLRIYFPDNEIRKLGVVTLHSDVDGLPLPASRFANPGAYTYTAEVPASSLRVPGTVVNFALDKALPSSDSEKRELGAVVTGVGFESQ